jgi:L-iditol 2-dehydrogenase
MNALFLTALRKLEYRTVPAMRAPRGWLRVRMRRVGICGSDIHYYTTGHIGNQIVRYPHILGHEGAGDILDGRGRFEKGQPVFIEPAISCGRCEQCLLGRENTCDELRFMGNPGELQGCMRDEIAMPPQNVVPLPKWMGLDQAALLEPLCIASHALGRSGAWPGCRCAIVGAGPIGLSVLLALGSIRPKQVLVSEPIPARRHAAARLGATRAFAPGKGGSSQEVADASKGGVDFAFECVGTQEAVDDAVRMLRPGGSLIVIGITEGFDRVTFDPHWLRRQEINIISVRRQNRRLKAAMALLKSRRDAPAVLLTHRFPPERATEGFELARRRGDGVIKALLTWDHPQ